MKLCRAGYKVTGQYAFSCQLQCKSHSNTPLSCSRRFVAVARMSRAGTRSRQIKIFCRSACDVHSSAVYACLKPPATASGAVSNVELMNCSMQLTCRCCMCSVAAAAARPAAALSGCVSRQRGLATDPVGGLTRWLLASGICSYMLA